MYENLFLGGVYSKRPHKTIVSWYRDILRKSQTKKEGTLYKLEPQVEIARDAYLDDPPSGQDSTTAITLHAAGFVRLATAVNRGVYIGREGIHMNPRWFVRDQFDSVKLDSFESDLSRKDFSQRPVTVHREESVIPGFQRIDQI